MDEFNLIKHRLLDKAGEVGRITESLIYESSPGDGAIARALLGNLGV